MKSPCHGCSLKRKNKNSDECLKCKARIAYAESVANPYIVENISRDISIMIPRKKRNAA